MKNDLQYMFKKVFIYDCIIAVVIGIIIAIINITYVLPAVSGLFIATVIFLTGGIITNYVVTQGKGIVLSVLFYMLKIFIVAGIGIMFFMYNKYDVIAYMFGFISHFVSLILYGLSIRDK